MLRFFACVMLLLPAFGTRVCAAEEPRPTSDTATLVEAIRLLTGQQLYQTYKNLDSLVEFQLALVGELVGQHHDWYLDHAGAVERLVGPDGSLLSVCQVLDVDGRLGGKAGELSFEQPLE